MLSSRFKWAALTLSPVALLVFGSCLNEDSPTPTAPPASVQKAGPAPRTATVLNSAFVIVNFEHETIDATPAQVEAVLFDGPTSINSLYTEMSHGALSWGHNVFGNPTPYIIPDPTGCHYTEWGTAANAAVWARDAIDLDDFDYVVYIFPYAEECAPRIGETACGSSKSYFFGHANDAAGIAHEMGHLLGNHHAGASIPPIPYSEIGDLSDIMGDTVWQSNPVPLRQFNGPHMANAGFIPTNRVVREDCGELQGDYSVWATEVDPTTLQPNDKQLVLIRGGSTSGDYVGLSLRRPIGAFDSNPFFAQYMNKLSVHLVDSVNPDPCNYQHTTLVKLLGPGQSYDNTSLGIHVEVSPSSDPQTTGFIDFSVSRSDVLPPQAPSFFPPYPETTCSTLSFNFTTHDQGGSGINRTQVRRQGASTWVDILNTDCLGSQASPYTDALGGLIWGTTYTWEARGIDNVGLVGPVGLGVFEFEPADTTPPSTPTGVSGSAPCHVVTLTWNASSDACSGISNYEIQRTGASWTVSTAGLSFVDDTTAPNTMYTYKVRSKDRAGNYSVVWKSYKITTSECLPENP